MLHGILAATMIVLASDVPSPDTDLPLLLHITWSRGPNLPQGFQDSNGGVVGNTLVSACGFCAGHDNDKKPGKYPRGFLKRVWGIDLANQETGWVDLPEFPGAARQGLLSAVVGDAVYCWGGFSYSEPYCYADGYRLSKKEGKWAWDTLPALPWPVSGGMCCAIGPRIYVFGGADYNAEGFFTKTDRNGKIPRLGARLMVIDTTDPGRGWKALAECPGTPRWVGAFAAVKGTLYLVGGATGDGEYCTVVDNWAYNPAKDSWNRLKDLPVASGNFPNGAIVFKDRYLVLGGGYQYAKVANPDGTTRPTYGKAHRFQDKGEYYNDVFVYDTETGQFGRADSMPLNNNMSMMIVHGDQLCSIGGETGGAVVEGEFYGHHPELFLKGKIREVN